MNFLAFLLAPLPTIIAFVIPVAIVYAYMESNK